MTRKIVKKSAIRLYAAVALAANKVSISGKLFVKVSEPKGRIYKEEWMKWAREMVKTGEWDEKEFYRMQALAGDAMIALHENIAGACEEMADISRELKVIWKRVRNESAEKYHNYEYTN